MSTHRVWVYGDNVNTDLIYPGKYTYTLRADADIRAKALEDLDSEFASAVQPGDVIVAGRNWGCGSSREQAVTALRLCGVQAIIAASFGGLYFRNCVNQGVHPMVVPGLAGIVHTGDVIEIDREATLQRPINAGEARIRAVIQKGRGGDSTSALCSVQPQNATSRRARPLRQRAPFRRLPACCARSPSRPRRGARASQP